MKKKHLILSLTRIIKLKIKIINIGFLQFNVSSEIIILKSFYVNFTCPCEIYIYITIFNIEY